MCFILEHDAFCLHRWSYLSSSYCHWAMQVRLFRVVRVVKLMKAAPGLASLLVTVRSSTRHVLNLGVLLCLLFFIASSLGMELFGRISCSDAHPCKGLSRHANFNNVGMSFLTLFRVATGDNWSGILQDTLRQPPLCDSALNCKENCCASSVVLSSMYFVCFVVLAQFIMLNVVVAVLMKNLTEAVHLYDDVVLNRSTSTTSSSGHHRLSGKTRLASDSSLDDPESADEDVNDSSVQAKTMVQHSICARDPAIEPHVKELLVKLQKRTERQPEATSESGGNTHDSATATRSHALKASLHLVMAMIHMMSDAEKTRESLRSSQQSLPGGPHSPPRQPAGHHQYHHHPRRTCTATARRSIAHPLKATLRRPDASRAKVAAKRTAAPQLPLPPPSTVLSTPSFTAPLPSLLPKRNSQRSIIESTTDV
eukprot:m.127026 g.127026  ORF g.127026 m.127026 type:complete len:424 (-) comp17403_c0_seq1:949-2220(-)